MNIGRWAVIAVAIAATAACSDSAEPDSSDESSPAEGSAATESGEDGDDSGDSEVPEDVQAAVAERMVAMDGLFGEKPSEDPEVMSAEEFNEGAPESQVEAMEERGFEAAAYQSLEVPETTDAVRAVLRFETEKGAAEDVASGTDDLPGEAVTKRFDVPGVPGAVGFDIYGQTGLVGRNIAFSVGEYEYLLGYAAEAPPSKKQASRDEVADVAAQWYERVSELE